MSHTWHHSKKAEHFRPRARVRWRVHTHTWLSYRRPAPGQPYERVFETHTYVHIMPVPAWYRRMQNRLWRRRTAREVVRYGEVRTIRPRSAADYW